MESYNLINPLQKRVNEIKESLYPQQLLSAGNERMIYGTYEKSFENYSKLSLRNGNRVNEIDYYNNSIKELEQIEEAVLQLEKQIHSDKNNRIEFHAIISVIHNVKQFAKELIKKINNENVTSKNTIKPRNISSKLTYKWLIDEDKLYDFKKLLSKHNLIDNSIDFQSFKFILNQKPITEIKNRIVWQNDNATQLIYLINELISGGILKQKNKNFDYILLYQCFEKSNGEIFTEKGKSLKNNIDVKVSANFKAIVDNIISELLK